MGYKKSIAEIRINDTIIKSETYDFTWAYEAKDDGTPSFLTLRIPNLSKEFRLGIEVGDPVIFNFGFDEDIGALVEGTVETKTYESSDIVTNYTILKVLDVDNKVFGNVSKTYENKTTEYIIKDIATNLGLDIIQLDLGTNTSHITGYTAYGKGINIIKQLVEKNGSELKLEGNTLSIYLEGDEATENHYLYNFENGLLEEPKECEEEGKAYTHMFTALANNALRKNSIVRIESEDISSYCKILKYSVEDFVGTYYVKVLEV